MHAKCPQTRGFSISLTHTRTHYDANRSHTSRSYPAHTPALSLTHTHTHTHKHTHTHGAAAVLKTYFMGGITSSHTLRTSSVSLGLMFPDTWFHIDIVNS